MHLSVRAEGKPVKLTRSWRDAAQAWCEIAKALASSDDIEDRQLGQSIVDFARWLPGVRYKPPELQAQRELPGLERNQTGPRPPTHNEPAKASPQRQAPEPDWGR